MLMFIGAWVLCVCVLVGLCASDRLGRMYFLYNCITPMNI